MFDLQKTDGTWQSVGFSYLESLRMLMDWQLLAKGWQPSSVNSALLSLDDIFALRCRVKSPTDDI